MPAWQSAMTERNNTASCVQKGCSHMALLDVDDFLWTLRLFSKCFWSQWPSGNCGCYLRRYYLSFLRQRSTEKSSVSPDAGSASQGKRHRPWDWSSHTGKAPTPAGELRAGQHQGHWLTWLTQSQRTPPVILAFSLVGPVEYKQPMTAISRNFHKGKDRQWCICWLQIYCLWLPDYTQ